MEPRSPSKVRLPMLEICPGAFKIGLSLLLSLLLLSVGVYVVLRPGKDLYTSEMMYFTVVVDCGSTGTRVSVYEWMLKGGLIYRDLPILIHAYPDNATNAPSRKDSCQYHCMQTEPGLDKFVGNSSGVRASLEPLIIWAGTMEDVIKEHRFMYKKSWIRVLSGKEEAYYGWVALNYKMGIFNKSIRLPTLGLLDLGGSSLQVVAEIDESDEDEFVMKSKIGSFEHEMLAYSLPAFGLNEAFDRTVAMLSHSQALKESVRGTFEVSHPCLSSSFMQSYSCKGCFGLGSNDSEGFHSQVQRKELNTITLVGEPNWEMCQVLARAAAVNSSSSDWSSLTDSSKCKAGWASLSASKHGASHIYEIDIIYGTNVNTYNNYTISSPIGFTQNSKTVNLKAITRRVSRFHALSGFFAVYTKLNLSQRANLTKIWEKGQQLCSSQISISGNQNYAAQYCFRVPYLASLIEDALCLSNKEIMFGPGDVSWTLGAALVEGKFLWLNSKDHSNIIHENNRGVIFSSIFLFIVLLSLLFIVYCCQLKFPMPSKRVAAIGLSLPSYVRPKQRL
ncbi:hypothetical protein RHGRI_024387 [Rhododendron griersonianum]|uniref:Apyrase 7 n=1 Tax=Rhododendron griersonianum TaxID=479676 RepID=A0AAV6J764_9ERIC|nr:hypothetical protein RHGRI_024387 [Rhododendron griersonianum]